MILVSIFCFAFGFKKLYDGVILSKLENDDNFMYYYEELLDHDST